MLFRYCVIAIGLINTLINRMMFTRRFYMKNGKVLVMAAIALLGICTAAQAGVNFASCSTQRAKCPILVEKCPVRKTTVYERVERHRPEREVSIKHCYRPDHARRRYHCVREVETMRRYYDRYPSYQSYYAEAPIALTETVVVERPLVVERPVIVERPIIVQRSCPFLSSLVDGCLSQLFCN
jgi:hypothetical protein